MWLIKINSLKLTHFIKIQWTSDCTRTLCRCEIMKEKKPMKKLRKKQNQILTTLQNMSRKEISKILRCKVNALCVIEIHSRDCVDKLYKMGIALLFSLSVTCSLIITSYTFPLSGSDPTLSKGWLSHSQTRCTTGWLHTCLWTSLPICACFKMFSPVA